ncbi:MAG: hypothetical protein Q7T87_12290 [Polaromonas sp.]|nr:hypothetical protein [Polaromonas sp.]
MNNTSLRSFESVLEREGLVKGLQFLNKRVLHRFTALYRMEGDVMRSVCSLDKEGGTGPADLDVVPVIDSFCQFVIREGGFVTASSARDQRLYGKKYVGVVASYVGLPLNDRNGELWGTFCHLDLVARPINEMEFEFLQRATSLLTPYLDDYSR